MSSGKVTGEQQRVNGPVMERVSINQCQNAREGTGERTEEEGQWRAGRSGKLTFILRTSPPPSSGATCHYMEDGAWSTLKHVVE